MEEDKEVVLLLQIADNDAVKLDEIKDMNNVCDIYNKRHVGDIDGVESNISELGTTDVSVPYDVNELEDLEDSESEVLKYLPCLASVTFMKQSRESSSIPFEVTKVVSLVWIPRLYNIVSFLSSATVEKSEGVDELCFIDKIVVEVARCIRNVLEEEIIKLQALEDIEWDKEFGMISDKVVEVKSDESAHVVSVLTEDISSNPVTDDEAESFECEMDCIKETKIDSNLILKHESDYVIS
ncbi:hypothetical protein Tco_0711317 [Tanacetum coccineum]